MSAKRITRRSATKKASTKKPLAAPAPTSKEELVEDIIRVQKENPDATLTRNFYRVHGKFSEGIWQGYFGRFSDFRKAAGMEPEPDTKNKEVVNGDLVYREKVIYNSGTDTYVIFLDRAGVRLLLSGEQVRGMKQAYSNWDGQPQTINEICRVFGIRRDWFLELKTLLGMTHDSEPFTEEEMSERPEEDMVKDALQAKRLSLYRTFEKAKWAETKANSDKWVNFEQNVFLPLMAHIEKNAPMHEAPMLNLKPAKEKFSVVVAPFDLHFGKHGWADETGESYSREEARSLLLEHTSHLGKYISLFGRPEKIICASASDYFHIDNPMGTTTRGTPQDCDGTRAQILIEGCELAVEHGEQLMQLAPVEWLGVAGNHDQDSALTVMLYMKAWFRNSKQMTVDVSPQLRRYTSYGNSLLGFYHGHGMKVNDMHAVMSKEARELWRKADWHYAFSGHLHHEVAREIHGIKHFQVSSLAGHDRWHTEKGYITSSRAMQAYIVSQDRGIIAEFISPVIHPHHVTGVKLKRAA